MMYIKGFDKNLQCRGFQFEIGKEYKTNWTGDKPLELCSKDVFHFCDNLKDVHNFYRCNIDNRYCEIEVLGEIVKDSVKMGSNYIKILREIKDDELKALKGLINGNSGLFNSGDYNSGDCNSGDYNSGNWNSGDWNSGNSNSGNWNSGNWNSGNRNSGNSNSGDYNSGDWNSGDYNSGDYNSGDYNSGDCNSGVFNKCNNSNGIFCTKEPTINIFNMPTKMTLSEFINSIYYKALISKPLKLTEWICYSDKEMKEDKNKVKIGGYLKTYTYKEACQNWWNSLSSKNKEIIKSIPNFNADIFEEITGIKL